GGDPVVYEYDTEVLEVHHNGECGCRSACELEVTIPSADAEFIAASPTLVAGLLDELDCLETDLEAAAYRHVQLQARIGKRDRTLARIQAVAADVDQDGGHTGPTLARHILNIIGGEA
ncbi:hypothetical protein, partial [Gordonia sp. UCD-TK1]|uniref:hypothetical protein n=1 Tax=Gordonia sp. UCD-TK1 TaxID=1857893 RepID=UPI001586AED9